MTNRRTSWLALALSLTAFSVGAAGCGDGPPEPAIALPTAPSLPAPAAPTISTTAPVALFGIASEISESGQMFVAGVEVTVASCVSRGGCVTKSTLTSEHGTYRIDGLYPGPYNYVWVEKNGYEPVGLPHSIEVCDDCNKILTLDGETEFDFTLARR